MRESRILQDGYGVRRSGAGEVGDNPAGRGTAAEAAGHREGNGHRARHAPQQPNTAVPRPPNIGDRDRFGWTFGAVRGELIAVTTSSGTPDDGGIMTGVPCCTATFPGSPADVAGERWRTVRDQSVHLVLLAMRHSATRSRNR
ncbi:hypothetical protein ACQ856_29105 (plasmid) [Mycolicibacterium psychrotolerans]|uniref:hypothetical protein n=1 Tax=Mycolicibacterium psychrotolerans TaxID=216929 RepID=UPI003D66AE17